MILFALFLFFLSPARRLGTAIFPRSWKNVRHGGLFSMVVEKGTRKRTFFHDRGKITAQGIVLDIKEYLNKATKKNDVCSRCFLLRFLGG